jgi:hypothetical protein
LAEEKDLKVKNKNLQMKFFVMAMQLNQILMSLILINFVIFGQDIFGEGLKRVEIKFINILFYCFLVPSKPTTASISF